MKAVARSLALLGALAGTPCALAAPQLTPAQLRADLTLARDALKEVHGGIYRYSTRQEVDRAFDAAQAKLDHPMDAWSFLRILAPAVASVRCGHTGVQWSPEMRQQLERAALLPLDVKLIDGKLFILRDYASAAALAGSEILTINDVPVSSIVATLTAAAPGDGFIATGRANRIARTFKEGLFNQLGMQGQFALGVRSQKNGTQLVHVSGQPLAALEAASARLYPQDQRSKKFIALSFLDEGHIARLQVFNFMDDAEEDDGESLLRQAFEKIAASGAQTLLLDLRDNGGGEDSLGKQLYAHLVERPFPYYEELRVNRPGLSFAGHVEGRAGMSEAALLARPGGGYTQRSHPNLGIQQPAAPTYRGKVIALINGSSFSTTAELITQLHDKQRAVFVGEESGGAYQGNSSGRSVALVLPNSALKVVIPLVTYALAIGGSHPNGRGVTPEHTVTASINDYLDGRDRQLETALALARSDK
jgi:hypothetical protein